MDCNTESAAFQSNSHKIKGKRIDEDEDEDKYCAFVFKYAYISKGHITTNIQCQFP